MTGTQSNLQPAMMLVPGANLNAYIQSVSSIPVLSRDREQELADAYYYQENLEAARELIISHLRFVVHIAKSYSGYGLSQADLVQEGNVGLMKAVKRYNPEKGVRLVSFAVHWIKAEIHEFVIRNWRIVKIATTKAQRKLFFNLRSSKQRLAWLSHDEAKAVAKDLGVELKDVQQMEGRLAASDMTFDAPTDADDEQAFAPVHYLEDHTADPAQRLEDEDWEDNSQKQLYAALEKLDDRSRDILRRRWLSENKATLHDLAAEYGISAERIRQLEQNAMKKVKATLLV
ncbi:MAG: RNA polymerase sigma factor RpoH [Pseudomonadales bacterium]